jgi:hypothetical protein
MRFIASRLWSLLFVLSEFIYYAISFGTLASRSLPNASCDRVHWGAPFHPLNELDCKFAIDLMREKVIFILGPPDNLGFLFFEGRSLTIESRGRNCIAAVRLSVEYDFDHVYVRWDHMHNALLQIFRECVQRHYPISGYISNYRGLTYKITNADLFDAAREAVPNAMREQRRLQVMRTLQQPRQASSEHSHQASSRET